MTERVQRQLLNLKSEVYKSNRSDEVLDITKQVTGKHKFMRSAMLLDAWLSCEKPYFQPEDRFGFNRSKCIGSTYIQEDGQEIPLSGTGNMTPDYETVLAKGMVQTRDEVRTMRENCKEEQKVFYNAVLLSLDAALKFAEKYRDAAKEAGMTELYEALCRVPHESARTLHEACVFLKFILFTLRCARNDHMTLGRFDQYMRPYYERDLEKGKTREELFELVEEFFISINYDTDLYFGQQLGDNGQSMVLGGCDREGKDAFSDFSKLCMEASLELNLIDPKINLRVTKDTSIELLEFGTLMTKQGLGFPQYNNDDVVIPGLVKLGYSLEDARDYAVAACWEFIIPGKGMDWANVRTLNFPKIVAEAINEELPCCDSFDAFMKCVEKRIGPECDRLIVSANERERGYSPYLSVFVKGCLESGQDVSEGGAIYNNYGFHGAGISTAADSLAAIKEVIFEKQEYTKEELLEALSCNYEGHYEMRNRLLACPKMGNNDDGVDQIASELMNMFANALKGKKNKFGGIIRPGTGSALEYVRAASMVLATPDGRKAGEPYGSSFSPSLECKLKGPFSCIQSFTKHDMSDIINGGPLTLEIHSSTFRGEEGVKKVARLVKAYIELGGHQLQLNAVNRETLLDALQHPEQHKNLIVRVWGWSGHFTELERKYQEHIIKRTEFTM